MPRPPRVAPTLDSVATVAGVSRQTVSNVINAPDRVASVTLGRVRTAIEELGYRPNRVARSLRVRASHQIGFCVSPLPPGTLNPVLDRFLHAITTAAAERGFHVLLFTAPTGSAGLDRYAELLAQQAVDGFVLTDTVVGDTRQGWLHERGVPFVAFGRTWRHEDEGAWVDVDGAAGVARAVEHVHGLGHRRIAIIGWPAGSGVGDDRLAGYERACLELGVTPQIVRDVGGIERGPALAARLLDADDPPTALICVSDQEALGALRALAERGMRPGHDVAVVGYDDTPAAALPGIDLTSIAQPVEEIGQVVMDMLLDLLEAGGPPAGPMPHRLLAPRLVIRSSTAPEDRP